MLIPDIQCSIIDSKGNHCPERVIQILTDDDKIIYLCDKDYLNCINGMYGEHLAEITNGIMKNRSDKNI